MDLVRPIAQLQYDVVRPAIANMPVSAQLLHVSNTSRAALISSGDHGVYSESTALDGFKSSSVQI